MQKRGDPFDIRLMDACVLTLMHEHVNQHLFTQHSCGNDAVTELAERSCSH
jgi:hypothetical protein